MTTLASPAVSGSASAPAPIAATAVPREARRHHLFQHFRQYCDQVEFAIFHQLVQLCEDYRGGVLTLRELSNGGCYMAPAQDLRLHLVCEGNGFDGTMGADAAGIAASLMALSHLSFALRSVHIVTAYHQLRAFATAHAEADVIVRAID